MAAGGSFMKWWQWMCVGGIWLVCLLAALPEKEQAVQRRTSARFTIVPICVGELEPDQGALEVARELSAQFQARDWTGVCRNDVTPRVRVLITVSVTEQGTLKWIAVVRLAGSKQPEVFEQVEKLGTGIPPHLVHQVTTYVLRNLQAVSRSPGPACFVSVKPSENYLLLSDRTVRDSLRVTSFPVPRFQGATILFL